MFPLIRIADLPFAVKRVHFVRYVTDVSVVYCVSVGFHVVFAREFLFTYVALEFGRHVAARQLVTLQMTAAFEQLETFGTIVLGSHAAFLGQVKAQVGFALVVAATIRAYPSFV